MRFTYAHLNPYRELVSGQVLKVIKENAITTIYGLKKGQYLIVNEYNRISDKLPESLILAYNDTKESIIKTISIVLSKQLHEAFEITSLDKSQLKHKVILNKIKV